MAYSANNPFNAYLNDDKYKMLHDQLDQQAKQWESQNVYAPMAQANDYGGWGSSINIYDPNSDYYGMAAMPKYQAAFDPSMLDTKGLDKFRDEALRTGPSTWDRLTKQSGAAQLQDQKENAMREGQAQTASAMDDLAARGGLSSGARERAQESGTKNYLNMSQNLTRQNNLNNLQVDVNDETNRISQLGQLPGMEMQAIQPAIAENQRRSDYDKWRADSQNQAVSANKQAKAQEQGK